MNETTQNIIEATIVCIEKYGLDHVTIRKISEEANVNSAAISYYFRSKEALIKQVMKITLENAFRWGDFAHTEPMPLEDQLCEIILFFAKSSIVYQNLGKAHMIQIAQNQAEQNGENEIFLSFLRKLASEIKRKSDYSEQESNEIVLLLTSWFFPFFSTYPHMFDEFTDNNIYDADYLEQTVRNFVKKLIQ